MSRPLTRHEDQMVHTYSVMAFLSAKSAISHALTLLGQGRAQEAANGLSVALLAAEDACKLMDAVKPGTATMKETA